MKICSKCKIEKFKSEFGKCKTFADNLQYQCKECQKEYYKLNSEYKIQCVKEYAKLNVEIIRKKKKEYNKKNAKHIKEKSKEYRNNNVEILKEKKKRISKK
jgi:hypothetical protein